ncbi:aldo/keto reductase [Flavobacterium sp.]|uniref:aldo/keto reductase n=1 Tax=Flavobacterium sp. TaxID=239 RepID=UPI0025BF3937|nr:aldo/keto reductase [Flavobacterium sp.]MBA4275816.1 aldo/keto reductase [Flavobacterium sp.]
MNRRNLLKTAGLAIAGSAILPFDALARTSNENQNSLTNDNTSLLVSDKRKLGKLEVSAIGLGVQNMHRTYHTIVPSRKEMHNIIQSAFDNGVTLFDTAEAYGPFECEKILGEATASFRDKIVIETKFGFNIGGDGRRSGGLNSDPDHIKKVVEASLTRLKTDRIDLLYQHRVDSSVPIEDVVGAIKDLIKEGKVLYYGLSEPGIQTVRRAHKEHPISAIQNEYSLLWRGPEAEIIPLCEELGIGFVPWSPLGMAFLTGAIDVNTRFAQGDFRGFVSRFSPENLVKNMLLVDLIKKWGIRKEATPAQISLAWLLAQKPWIVPIPGTTQMTHMKDNVGANNVKFTATELQEFTNELNAIPISGERLPAGVQAMSGVEAALKK